MRNSRSCNSLAFCNVDPNYLAVGLDKVRGDSSLLIWDIATTTPILSFSQYQHVDSHIHNHIQIQPAPGIHRPQPQIPRADVGPRADPRVLQQHAPTETVSSVCFLPQSMHLLLAGISSRWLRLFDLRSPGYTTNVASKVQGIATDPFDQYRIACFGDHVVTVWDARKLLLPLLSFTERDAVADGARVHGGYNSGYGETEFSSTRRGMLATLEKDALYVRFWDMIGAQPHFYAVDDVVSDENKAREAGKLGRRTWATLPWPAGQHQNPPSPRESFDAAQGSVVLHDTRRSKFDQFSASSSLTCSLLLAKTFPRALASFALVPNLSTQPRPLTSNVMVVNREGDLELYAMHDMPKQATWSARGDLAISVGQTCRVLQGFPESILVQGDDPPHRSHSNSRSREADSVLRGRANTMANSNSRPRTMTDPVIPPPPAPLFGRGDDEGFPALGSGARSGSRSGTPIHMSDMREKRGSITLDQWAKRNSVGSTVDGESVNTNATVSAADTVMTTRESMLNVRNRRSRDDVKTGIGSRSHSMSRGRRMGKGVSRVVEDDISMLMKKRALKGYGLSKVCIFFKSSVPLIIVFPA